MLNLPGEADAILNLAIKKKDALLEISSAIRGKGGMEVRYFSPESASFYYHNRSITYISTFD